MVSKDQSVSNVAKNQLFRRLRKGSKCPTCEVGKLIPIVYGMPGRGLIEQTERGEIELGGCVVSQVFDPERGFISGDPELSCPACEGRFFRNLAESLRNAAGADQRSAGI